ncbi:MAG TPA: dihydrolipoyl dehydrogenase [Ignavibacteria bacterium]|nr:dihydrolipoyl dehydrogenase [Bacteroidota bacterium]HRI85465.1 dihydrolipoyl dehydrogenase [Ignavibacteria bacterium]HRJ98973.1 dihydrolipoyl dehydrogenase [Ignavibacteria bacterium]
MKEFDVIVIGSGPGGYTTAIRASQLGFKTAIIEKDRLGGICLNWGCIPTKALLKNAELMNGIKHLDEFGITVENVKFDFEKIIARSRGVADISEKGVRYLMKKNKIEVLEGAAAINKDGSISVKDKSGKELEKVKAGYNIIATGARARSLGNLKFDEKRILSSTGAMILKDLPEKMTIVGSGAIGVEFAYFYNAFGTEVTIVEMLPNIMPIEDKDISDVVAREFKKRGIKLLTGTKTESVEVKGDKVYTNVSGKSNEVLESDVVLIAIGVTGNVENIGLEEIGIAIDKGSIKVDKDYKTNVDGFYAIGDVIGPPWLAHVASSEGINCIEKIKGMHVPEIDYNTIPGCTYCQPQVASVGLTEKKALEEGYEINVGKFPFSASGKSRALGETVGMIKVIFDKKYNELIGAHIVGVEATELIMEFVLAKSLEATHEQILKTVHAHPTLSEANMEAVGVAYNEAINI